MSADAIVSYALSLEGLSWSSTRERYVAELYPLDDERAAREMAASQESCGLTCEAILRRSEIDGSVRHRGQLVDALRTPIATRIASGPPVVSYLEALGRQRDAWEEGLGSARPGAGDMVVILGPTHALTVTDFDGVFLESIDGGQVDAGNSGKCTAIAHRRRALVATDAGLHLADAAGRQRRIYGWLRAGALPCL